MSTSQGSLFEAQLDCIKASLVREVKAIVDDDSMEHQASVNRGFREQREEIQRLRNSVETVKQRLSELEHDAANAPIADGSTACHGCQCQQRRPENRDFVRRSAGHPETAGIVNGLDRWVEGPISPAHDSLT
ncbi:hypothetical protein FB107DRAFT_280623 [Schizophyllum commune]